METSELPGQKTTGRTRRALLQDVGVAGAGLGVALLMRAALQRTETLAAQRLQALTGPTFADWEPLPPDSKGAAQALHVLNRIGYGPRPGDVARVAQMGVAAYIEEQLAVRKPAADVSTNPASYLAERLAEQKDDDPAVIWRVNALDTQQTAVDAPDALASMPDDQLLTETQQAALLRAVYSRHQLREVLADFWTNHFNIYALKNDGRVLIPVDTERVLRPHLMGTFREMLLASAQSPAMLAYLDNNQNRSGKANENYARELLELHTLGVKSGYTQRDIQEVARCFTGWTVKTGFQRGEFAYEADRHDPGDKYIPFLDLHIAAKSRSAGERDASEVLEALAAHPATARFVSRKLCSRFLGNAPDAAVERAATAYLKSGSDIRATLRPILLDALLSSPDNKPVLKRPLELVVSALRALAADTDGGANVQRHLAAMGQPLYQWPMPDGFPEKAAAWTGSLLPRWNFALALAGNRLPGTTVVLQAIHGVNNAPSDAALVNALLEAITNRPHDAAQLQPTRLQVQNHLERARREGVPTPTLLAEATGLIVAAPPFQWR